MIDNEQDFAPESIFLPLIFKRGNQDGELIFENLINIYSEKIIVDQFSLQKKELFRIRNAKKPLSNNELDDLYIKWLSDKVADNEGCWVFYSWLNRLIHTLDEDEFIELRTNRNYYKITPHEQNLLSQKTIGIIGLSVGHSVAITIATERICGTLKLSDFDTIELSNLNRIKTGIQNIGLNKCVVTAREIAEIDPFIKLECYPDGLHKSSIAEFLLANKKLDILIDECDDLEMKILCREEAKLNGIPVVMETSDRGMLDIERFDLERERPILHGLLKDFPTSRINGLTNEQKIPLILKIVDVKNGSARGKASMIEVGQTINTWPQLASAVTLGGGIVTDVCRRILLNSLTDSGRYYIDLEELVFNKKTKFSDHDSTNPFQPFNWAEALLICKKYRDKNKYPDVPLDVIKIIVDAGCQAPSAGNDQPWKWIFLKNRLFLFQDNFRAWSFGNFNNISTNISFGASYANIELKSAELGYQSTIIFQDNDESNLKGVIGFTQKQERDNSKQLNLADQIYSRCTNRNPSHPISIPEDDYSAMINTVKEIPEASLIFITDREKLNTLANIIASCDRIRVFNPQGHKDFVENEMRWTKEEVETSRDGIDLLTLGMSQAQLAAMNLIRQKEVIETLSEIGGGDALLAGTINLVDKASAIGIITLPEYSKENFFKGGIAMERLWLHADKLGYAIHPLISPFYLFPRIIHSNGEGLNEKEITLLKTQRAQFLSILPIPNSTAEVFMFKIAKADPPLVRSLRLSLEETFFVLNGDK